MKRWIEWLLMPPTSLYLGAVLGLCMRAAAQRLERGKRALRLFGTWSLVLSAGTLVALSVPQTAFLLLDSLQGSAPIPPSATSLEVGAIVVVAGDVNCDPPEYGPDQPGFISLQRCRYGAALARRTGLPLLISGGVLRPDRRPVSEVLREFVQDELHVPVRWVERRSRTTRENARFTAELLETEGIERVALVTHAWHMPRAKESFEEAGLWVLPAPTIKATPPANLRDAIVPRASALSDSCWALHEWLGRLWYRVS